MNKKIEPVIKKVGNIIIPVKRVDKGLCLRVHVCSAKDNKGNTWNISISGASMVIDIPNKCRDYRILFKDILEEIVKKEEK